MDRDMCSLKKGKRGNENPGVLRGSLVAVTVQELGTGEGPASPYCIITVLNGISWNLIQWEWVLLIWALYHVFFCTQKHTDCNRLLRKPEKHNSKTMTVLSGASNAEMLQTEWKLFLREENPVFPHSHFQWWCLCLPWGELTFYFSEII